MRKSTNSITAKPAPISASAVRFQARNVRSLAKVRRGSGGWPTCSSATRSQVCSLRASGIACARPTPPSAGDSRRAALLAHPLADEAAQARDEVIVLVGRVRRTARVDEQRVEVAGGEPVDDDLVDVRELRGAELVVAVAVEVVVGQPAVGVELLLVAEVLAVADVEVAARFE